MGHEPGELNKPQTGEWSMSRDRIWKTMEVVRRVVKETTQKESPLTSLHLFPSDGCSLIQGDVWAAKFQGLGIQVSTLQAKREATVSKDISTALKYRDEIGQQDNTEKT
ncbi:hypothetical protein DNTS_002770 [Danionella cerebrum]|uniref:Uncharacterized protein n=1 Tax=Danionella cerebrum TaxID=2873325 RepID=A0A553MKV2_9TELE|nr:hypothetical protein DNTS_002770 [Danionella translucida]